VKSNPSFAHLDVPGLNEAPFFLEREEAAPDVQARKQLMEISYICKEALSCIQETFVPIKVILKHPEVLDDRPPLLPPHPLTLLTSTTLFDLSNDMIFVKFCHYLGRRLIYGSLSGTPATNETTRPARLSSQ